MRFSIERGMSVRRFGSGPELVWIHGLGESSVSFEPVAAHARLTDYTHVLCDLPGYGRSPWPDEPRLLEAVADELAAWLAPRPPAVLIGHSMGGVLAGFVAERCAVRAVVDIDGNVSRGDCVFSAQAAAYSEAEFVAHGFATLRDKVYADGAAHAPLRGYYAAMRFASPRVFHLHAVDLVAHSERGTLASRLAALSVPVLFVAGAPDGICPESRAMLAAARVRTLALEPAGHWVYLDALEPFAAALAGFVAEL